MKEARAVYDELLKNYPSSKFVPEAHLAFADYYFAAGQLADAEARYKAVLKFPKARVYAYALYKLGWIALRGQRPNDALEAFYQALVATRGDATQATLAQAARADFVRTYAAIGTSARTYDPFARLDKSAPVEVIELLGDLARETAAPGREASAFEVLLTRSPGDARACHWQYRLAQATLAMRSATDAQKVKEIEALVHVYAAQKAPDDECREDAAAMAGEIAAAYHARWSKTQNLETLGYAEKLYASYVSAFPDDDDRRAAYAEVLWSRADRETNAKLRAQRWERCADVFATIATPQSAKAAALARMNAVDVAVPATMKVVLAKAPRRKPRERPLGPADAKLVAAITAYAKQATAPDDELAEMRLVVALTLRRYRHFDEAATVLDQLLAAHPKHPRAELAANLMLDSLIQAHELDEALQVAAAMAADPSLLDGKRDLQHSITLLRSRWKR
jgi:TolA-binding protein